MRVIREGIDPDLENWILSVGEGDTRTSPQAVRSRLDHLETGQPYARWVIDKVVDLIKELSELNDEIRHGGEEELYSLHDDAMIELEDTLKRLR